MAKAGVIWLAQFFRTVLGIPSGPIALCRFNSRNSFAMLGVVILICVICGWCVRGRCGCVEDVCFVNTDLNCCSSNLAFMLLSV